jgi:DHA2 family multidrug resistance protein
MTEPPGEDESRSAAGPFNPWLVAVVVSMATFMEVLDTSVANVSLPHIAGSLSTSVDESTWVLTSYLVANAIILPCSGWLATVIGRKRFYMLCVALFGASSLLCGIAPSLGWLLLFRVLQGIGGGGLAPSEQSILADTFPPEKRGQAFALYGVAVVVAPTLGPTLGGVITDNASWRWIFLINVPVCLGSLLMSSRVLHDPPAVRRDRARALRGGLRMDGLGFALVVLGLGALQIVLDRGQEDDWFASDRIVAFSLVALLSLVFLTFWELRHERPIVDLPLLRNRNFATASLMMFVTGFVLLSTTQLLPRFLQSILDYNATKAGLALTAGGVATMLMMPVTGALIRFVQPKYLIAAGLLVEALAALHLSRLNADIDFAHAAWARVFQAVGFPFLFVPITTLSYAGLPPDKSNNASALINSMRNLGASVGISVGTTLLARRGQFHHARLVESLPHVAHAAPARGAGALENIDRIVQRQADTLSYIDVFWFVAIVAAAAIPLTFVLRRIEPGAAKAGH